jgi:prepilin-type N-terminal cleavage/methylation domain-containing protein
MKGFTLVEMLTVVAIIGILVSILLPVLAGAKEKAKVAKARADMAGLELAIKQYETEYHRFPSTPTIEAASAPALPDFTFAGTNSWNPHANKVWNSVVMEILLNLDAGANAGHLRNPRKLILLHAKQQAGDLPGLSTTDHVFRDPWGTPYIITIDLNGDEKCIDAAYGNPAMHTGTSGDAGYYGLTKNAAGTYELNRSVMIWSLGRDKQVDPGSPAISGVNKDNILNWQ